jgi:heme/copper-type cytochrome/quinol oxidase subunit 4
MIEDIKKIQSTKKELKKFGLSVGPILVIISFLLYYKKVEAFWYFSAIGVILLGSATIIPVILKPIYLVWMGTATIIGWAMTRLILSLLFYIVLTPLSLILRLFGKKFLELGWEKTQDTYWNYRNLESPGKDSYKNQF